MAATDPVCLQDFERIALRILPKYVAAYYESGGGDEVTLKENIEAFKRYKIMPRYLIRDVSKRNTATTILGHKIRFPVCIAPTAVQKLAHPEGEVATARAAASSGIGYTMSIASTCSIEDIAEGSPNCLRFFQMYIYKDRKNIALQLLRRAEKAGFSAILLTIDTPIFGKRRAQSRNKFSLPPHLSVPIFKDLGLSSGVSSAKQGSGLNENANSSFDASLTWSDVLWLKSVSNLPVVVKGVVTVEDALQAVNCNVDGILVSNHGGRQLDGIPATIEVLPEIVRAVGSRVEVYLDGGIRTGTDVLKAMALGAKAVFIGRPVIYALAYKGEAGVAKMLDILHEEFSEAMALTGCSEISHIDRKLIVHESHFAKL